MVGASGSNRCSGLLGKQIKSLESGENKLGSNKLLVNFSTWQKKLYFLQ